MADPMTLQLLLKVTNVLTYILIVLDTSQFKNFSLWGDEIQQYEVIMTSLYQSRSA